MTLSAIVLAGGRSSRLGGVPKATLFAPSPSAGSQPVALVRRVVDAVLSAGTAAEAVAVVGPPSLASQLPRGVHVVQEVPRFAGPAAAIAAGAKALQSAQEDCAGEKRCLPGEEWTFLLSCDLADPEEAVNALLSGLTDVTGAGSAGYARSAKAAGSAWPVGSSWPAQSAESARSGTARSSSDAHTLLPHAGAVDVVAARTDRVQHLVSMVRTEALRARVGDPHADFAHAPVRALTRGLAAHEVPVAESVSRDVDTWDDAVREGLLVRTARGFEEAARTR